MQLKGTNKSGSGTTKTKRDNAFKLRVLQLKDQGKSAKEALEQACKETGLPLTQGMIDHPHSFVNMYKVSVNKGLSKGNKALEAQVAAAGLAQDEPAAKVEEPEADEEDEAEEFEPEIEEDDDTQTDGAV